jgi:hypothetical protein
MREDKEAVPDVLGEIRRVLDAYGWSSDADPRLEIQKLCERVEELNAIQEKTYGSR